MMATQEQQNTQDSKDASSTSFWSFFGLGANANTEVKDASNDQNEVEAKEQRVKFFEASRGEKKTKSWKPPRKRKSLNIEFGQLLEALILGSVKDNAADSGIASSEYSSILSGDFAGSPQGSRDYQRYMRELQEVQIQTEIVERLADEVQAEYRIRLDEAERRIDAVLRDKMTKALKNEPDADLAKTINNLSSSAGVSIDLMDAALGISYSTGEGIKKMDSEDVKRLTIHNLDEVMQKSM